MLQLLLKKAPQKSIKSPKVNSGLKVIIKNTKLNFILGAFQRKFDGYQLFRLLVPHLKLSLILSVLLHLMS